MQAGYSNHGTRRSYVAAPLMGAFMAVLLLSGCSSLQFAYSFADDVLEGRADEYLNLNEDQEAVLEEQTAAMIRWHRQEMLPKYATFFRAQADIAEAGGWSREGLSDAFQTFRGLMDETVEGASPFIATVMAEHRTEDKIAYLEARMAENLAERRADEEAETAEESADEWVERRVDRLSRFLGDLTDEQVAIVRSYTEDGMDDGLRWLENREQRQGAFVTFLRTEPTRDEIAQFVHRILLRAYEVVDPDYKTISERRWALRERMYFDVLETLSDEQRDTLIFTLRDYADDMLSLAGV